MQLPQRQHRLLVLLLIEGDRDEKTIRIIILIGTVVERQPIKGRNFCVFNAVAIDCPVGSLKLEAPATAHAKIEFKRRRRESAGAKPLVERRLIRKRFKDRLFFRGQNTREHNLTLQNFPVAEVVQWRFFARYASSCANVPAQP